MSTLEERRANFFAQRQLERAKASIPTTTVGPSNTDAILRQMAHDIAVQKEVAIGAMFARIDSNIPIIP